MDPEMFKQFLSEQLGPKNNSLKELENNTKDLGPMSSEDNLMGADDADAEKSAAELILHQSGTPRGMCKLLHDVPEAVREKIWTNIYVDLQTLLTDKELPEPITLAYSESSDKIIFEHTDKKKTSTITNWQIWLETFLIFHTVYVIKFTNRAPEINTYIAYIISQAKLHPRSRVYRFETKFRKSLHETPNNYFSNKCANCAKERVTRKPF